MTRERFNPEGYDIDPNLFELYRRAFWVVEGEKRSDELLTEMLETISCTRSMDATGVYPERDPIGRPWDKAGEAKGLADRIVQIENETDFRLIQIVPHSSSVATAFFRRTVLMGLSIPEKIGVKEETKEDLTSAVE